MKIRPCPCCKKNRYDNSPYSYVWWHVLGAGLLCYACYDKRTKSHT